MITILAVAATAAIAGAGPASDPAGFELSRIGEETITREQAAPRDPVRPANLDTRDFAIDMPEFELSLAEQGPVLLVGAMGGRSGGKYGGLPKLAHVAIGWRF